MSDSASSLPIAPGKLASPTAGVASPAVTYIDNWLRRLPWAVLVVDANLHCLWANPAARTMADQGRITLTDGRLTIGDTATTDSLRAFVAGMDRLPETWVTKTNQGDHLVVRGDIVDPLDLPTAVALVIKSTAETRRHSVWADLRHALGLTRSEALIVTRLVDGDSADDIAVHLGVSVDTVRSHIRRAYIKLDVGTREQLFAKVSPFRIG